MSIRNLDYLFKPHSVAVIGASQRPHSVGATVLHNMIEGGFSGILFPVNPKYDTLAGRQVYARVGDLPTVPELAVICTPPATVPGIISELGTCGTKAAIVLTAGLGAMRNKQGNSLKQAMLAAAKPHLLRILGPQLRGLTGPRYAFECQLRAYQRLVRQTRLRVAVRRIGDRRAGLGNVARHRLFKVHFTRR